MIKIRKLSSAIFMEKTHLAYLFVAKRDTGGR